MCPDSATVGLLYGCVYNCGPMFKVKLVIYWRRVAAVSVSMTFICPLKRRLSYRSLTYRPAFFPPTHPPTRCPAPPLRPCKRSAVVTARRLMCRALELHSNSLSCSLFCVYFMNLAQYEPYFYQHVAQSYAPTDVKRRLFRLRVLWYIFNVHCLWLRVLYSVIM